MDQILNRYGVGVAGKAFEELREMIFQLELLLDQKIENCKGGKLLGQAIPDQKSFQVLSLRRFQDSHSRSSPGARRFGSS